ncbi:molybdopterin molybdotransferase MoeA [Gymnodinialimonas ceratoperidinii]|uniref:Molybdopterin molybdenumtransferase n=1 Tax=Gymnodinialimonas ceratoperidinii TaxID=2856823 RepID=A0A8F6TV33_9RHOB|nr:gephyrin-like molybdotransferase Glp [Gymnodinialimonas ceratoperidinii]QXT38704.1 molybdopterin molybdotransferase MoeA [Gymnodinialimonas ceratoperidinii]
MISVEDALAACLDLAAPVGSERVALTDAGGRVLVAPVTATRDQPPFSASAMDGYALRDVEAIPGRRLKVVGEAPAGRHWSGTIGPGEALRIFTGAPLPDGTDRVVIQEDVSREGDRITLGRDLGSGHNVRPSGADFVAGDTMSAPRRLSPADVALAASMNVPLLEVSRRPTVALIATGDELVTPGESPRPDQIIASNTYGLKARIEAEGAEARLLPIARDNRESLEQVFDLAAGADLIVTVGGASVGDHDLVGDVAASRGLDRAFYKVAMRPGKPLMAGRLGDAVLLGLPGNPVSAMVCGELFLIPMLQAMMGLPAGARPRLRARLGVELPANGPREHYMRAEISAGEDLPIITPYGSQDSSLLTVLSGASGLLVRPVDAPRTQAGEMVEYVPLHQMF